MDTFKTKIVLEKNHSLDLENLPFKKGDEIEIVINPINKKKHQIMNCTEHPINTQILSNRQ